MPIVIDQFAHSSKLTDTANNVPEELQAEAPPHVTATEANDGKASASVNSNGAVGSASSGTSDQNSLSWAQSAISEVDELIDMCQTNSPLGTEDQSEQALADRHFAFSVLHQTKRQFILQFVKNRPLATPSPSISIDEVWRLAKNYKQLMMNPSNYHHFVVWA